jgi:hypothetical protein
MTTRCLVAIAAAIMTTMVVLPADARAKKVKRPDAQQQQTPSLDGRITGRPRTCGYETFQYDGEGVPRAAPTAIDAGKGALRKKAPLARGQAKGGTVQQGTSQPLADSPMSAF